MRMYDVILKKRNGGELSRKELALVVSGYTNGNIPDYQMSALLMAIYYKGMSERETADLTEFMANSGDTMDLSLFGNLSVDKHSTGGVGDKTSLIVGPIVASLGCKVTKMSGRGLGHTGGTVDKLEAIPGYKTDIPIDEFLKQVQEIGIAVIGQTGNLTPADKKIYALRDVTATVDSIPLIASSIMSKKIAAGSHNIVLDTKFGNGAFMKSEEDAELLAQEMVKIGKHCGRNMAAVLSNMNSPLGNMVGNSLEVMEAVEILKGENQGDLKDLSVELAAVMVSLSKNIDETSAKDLVLDSITSGKAYSKMKEWISFQGGDISYIEDTNKFRKAKFIVEVLSQNEGYLSSMNTEEIGITSGILGGGRLSKEDTIDFSAGIEVIKKTGDFVKKGEVVAKLFTNNEKTIDTAKERYLGALKFTNEKPQPKPLIYKIIR